MDNLKSTAWKKCLRDYPKLEITSYPKAPNNSHLATHANLEEGTDTKPSKMLFKGNLPCVNLNTISQHCEKCDTCKHVVHLLTNKDDARALIYNDHSPYLNYVETNVPR